MRGLVFVTALLYDDIAADLAAVVVAADLCRLRIGARLGGQLAGALGEPALFFIGIADLAAPLVCLAVFGSGSFLLPSMACILILLLALRRPIEKAEGPAEETEEVGA